MVGYCFVLACALRTLIAVREIQFRKSPTEYGTTRGVCTKDRIVDCAVECSLESTCDRFCYREPKRCYRTVKVGVAESEKKGDVEIVEKSREEEEKKTGKNIRKREKKPGNIVRKREKKPGNIVRKREKKPGNIVRKREKKPGNIVRKREKKPGNIVRKREKKPGNIVRKREKKPGNIVRKREKKPGNIVRKSEKKPGNNIRKREKKTGKITRMRDKTTRRKMKYWQISDKKRGRHAIDRWAYGRTAEKMKKRTRQQQKRKKEEKKNVKETKRGGGDKKTQIEEKKGEEEDMNREKDRKRKTEKARGEVDKIRKRRDKKRTIKDMKREEQKVLTKTVDKEQQEKKIPLTCNTSQPKSSDPICGQTEYLYDYSKAGSLKGVKMCVLKLLENVNCRTEEKWLTPVIAAAYRGHTDVFDFLISKGSNLWVTDKNRNTVLHYASMGGSTGIVRELLEKHNMAGCVNKRGRHNKTPLMNSVLCGSVEMFDLLVKYGGNAHLHCDNNMNILHLAVKKGRANMTEHILQTVTNLDINEKTLDGITPVMLAVYTKQLQVVKMFQKKCCDMTCKDKDGNTLLHIAAINSDVDMMEYLASLRVIDLHAKNKKGENAREIYISL